MRSYPLSWTAEDRIAISIVYVITISMDRAKTVSLTLDRVGLNHRCIGQSIFITDVDLDSVCLRKFKHACIDYKNVLTTFRNHSVYAWLYMHEMCACLPTTQMRHTKRNDDARGYINLHRMSHKKEPTYYFLQLPEKSPDAVFTVRFNDEFDTCDGMNSPTSPN